MNLKRMLPAAMVAVISLALIGSGMAADPMAQEEKESPSEPTVAAAPPTGQAILVKNAPQPPDSAQTVPPVPVPTASEPPKQAPTEPSTKLIVCRARGFELKGLSPEECKAQGGTEIVTHELVPAEKPSKSR